MGEAQQNSARQKPGTTRNNWHTKRLKLIALAGTVTENAAWVRDAQAGAKIYINECLYPDGTSNDLKERDALAYHISGLFPLLVLALRLAPGTDLFHDKGASGASLAQSVAYVRPYAAGEKTREEWRNTKVELDRRRAQAGLTKYTPGRLFEPKAAAELFALAACFEPSYAPLAARLADRPGKRFASFASVLAHCAVSADAR